MTSRRAELLLGLKVPLQGLKLIRSTPRAKGLALAPFLVYLLLFAAGVWFTVPVLDRAMGRVGEWLSGLGMMAGLIGGLLVVVSWVIVGVVLAFLIFLVARIVAAPFHALMSEGILKQQGIISAEAPGIRQWLHSAVQMMGATIVESILFLILGVVLFIFSFVPGLNLVAGFIALLIMAFDSAAYSFEVLQMSLRQRLAFVISHIWFFAGLAMAMGITIFMPLLNFLLFPAAVAGSAGAMKILLYSGDTGNDSRSGPPKNN